MANGSSPHRLISYAVSQTPLDKLKRPELSTVLQDAFSRVPVRFHDWCRDGALNHIYLLCQGDAVMDWDYGVNLALQNTHTRVACVLLDRGATNHNDVLIHAIRFHDVELLMYMVDRWSDVCNWELAIRVALAPTTLPIVHTLVDCDVCDWDTIIVMASRLGDLDMIDVAIFNGATMIRPAIDIARKYERNAVALYLEKRKEHLH